MRGLTGLLKRRKAAEVDGSTDRPRPDRRGRARETNTADLARISAEVESVARYVAQLRREIGYLRGNDIFRDRLPAARTDVDDARKDVRTAVGQVLDACERLLASSNGPPELVQAEVEARAVEIMEACCFDDVLTQRLARIDTTLEYTARRMQRFALAVGIPDSEHPLDRRVRDDNTRRELMVEGPQTIAAAANQSEIDRMFS